MKRLVALGSLVALLLLAALSCAKTPPAGPAPSGNTPLPAGNQTAVVILDKPNAGDAAPDLQLMDMAGRTVSLADYKGQIVWLNFWATW